MTANRPAMRMRRPRLGSLSRALAWLSCLLFLGTSVSPGVLFPSPLARIAPLESTEHEERVPLEDEDDGKEGSETGKEVSHFQHERNLRHRRSARHGGVGIAWLAHLPHPHAGTAGFVLPSSTPFGQSANLPLRC